MGKKIELVAWDVYGTIIDAYHDETSDVETRPILRAGALEVLSYISSIGIEQITISDDNLTNLKHAFQELGINWGDYFFDLYQMTPSQPKDILAMCEYYKKFLNFKFDPERILVIGDNEPIDICLAREQKCKTLHVPIENEYGANPLPTNKILEFIKESNIL